jgi:hypothetical protein
MTSFRWVVVLLVFTFIALTLSISLLSRAAYARADFGTWANRSTHVVEPAGYNTTGSPACKICEFSRKFNDMGNLGIGNGNISLIKPDYLKEALNVTGIETGVAGNNTTGLGTPAPMAYDFETENLLPLNVLAGAATVEGRPDTITLGHPFLHILMEDPTEASVLYGKLLGLPLPAGSVMDVGIKSIGYEY